MRGILKFKAGTRQPVQVVTINTKPYQIQFINNRLGTRHTVECRPTAWLIDGVLFLCTKVSISVTGATTLHVVFATDRPVVAENYQHEDVDIFQD